MHFDADMFIIRECIFRIRSRIAPIVGRTIDRSRSGSCKGFATRPNSRSMEGSIRISGPMLWQLQCCADVAEILGERHSIIGCESERPHPLRCISHTAYGTHIDIVGSSGCQIIQSEIRTGKDFLGSIREHKVGITIRILPLLRRFFRIYMQRYGMCRSSRGCYLDRSQTDRGSRIEVEIINMQAVVVSRSLDAQCNLYRFASIAGKVEHILRSRSGSDIRQTILCRVGCTIAPDDRIFLRPCETRILRNQQIETLIIRRCRFGSGVPICECSIKRKNHFLIRSNIGQFDNRRKQPRTAIRTIQLYTDMLCISQRICIIVIVSPISG